MSPFEQGKIYRNDEGSDVDLQIIRILQEDKEGTKIEALWLYRSTHNVLTGDIITIPTKTFKNWYEVTKPTGFKK